MAELDVQIRTALEALQQGRSAKEFDIVHYMAAFQNSAYEKAQSVLDQISNHPILSALRPVFLSIGGGDGAELEYLLQHSSATAGMVIEGSRPLAEAARQRAARLSSGKEMTVFEGDAKLKIEEAVAHATSLVAAGLGDYVGVTCHAVLHELFDRGDIDFDPVGFFATIFEDYTTSTWFTYREPGVPEKWPEVVLVQAACDPHSLLPLAYAICDRHPSMKALRPEPKIVGDHVRLHRILAMEVLAKLFYQRDLAHEIEERSTAVDHGRLTNLLWYAIGDRAREASRANILTISQPTRSFLECWQQFGVTVLGMKDDASFNRLPIAESQSRIIAWRLADTGHGGPATSIIDQNVEDPVLSELALARQCLNNSEQDLLCALLASKARAWIESAKAVEALELLREIRERFPVEHGCHLWSHYALCLAKLFAGEPVQAAYFAPKLEEVAKRIGIELLFKAERMEFHRKAGELESAVTIGNELFGLLASRRGYAADSERYVYGTAAFLIGNLLRHGGLYQQAWDAIDRAQSILHAGPAAQATELAHCYYAKAVCVAMTGISQFDAPFDEGQRGSRRFANALITLSYSHASWFLGNELRARQYALQAGNQFAELGFEKYAARARNLAALLGWWQSLQAGHKLEFEMENQDLARIVRIIIGFDEDSGWLVERFSQLRPSVAIGILQFWHRYGGGRENIEVTLPPVLERDEANTLKWRRTGTPVNLRRADEILRAACSIPEALRVPLIAD
jgi:hypothetical protein